MDRDLLTWLIFFTVVSLVILSINFYIGLRLTGTMEDSAFNRWLVWGVLGLLSLVILVAPLLRFIGSKIPQGIGSFLIFFGYTYLGALVFLSFSLLFIDILKLVISPGRRDFLNVGAPWVAMGLTGLASIRGYATAQDGPQIVPVEIPLTPEQSQLNGLKIAQISDLHVSHTIRKSYVEKVVKQTLAQEPDIILLTGDFVDGTYQELKEDVDPLKDLSAPYGVYYVTGNHEYYWGHEDWEKVFAGFGFQILHNSSQSVMVGGKKGEGAKVSISGVPDFTFERTGRGKIDVDAALNGAQGSVFSIFMVHQPSGYKLVQKHHRCDLMVSGHTHAGQFFPVSLFIGLFHKYARGLHRHDGHFWVYVNPGTGYWGPVNRLGVPSEITLFTLRG